MATNRRANKRKILVVANKAVEGAALRDAINGDPRAEVLVIAPALNSRLRYWLSDEDEARRNAELRLAASLERLGAAGIEALGRVGDPDPIQAISDALHGFEAQEIVIANSDGRSHWLTLDLVGRARRRFSQPVVQVVAGLNDESESPREATTRGRRAWIARGADA